MDSRGAHPPSAACTHPCCQQPVFLCIIKLWQYMVTENISVCAQVELPANTRVEYKYVIMEEQVTALCISECTLACGKIVTCQHQRTACAT